jgi:hypothetical protein
MELWRMPHTCRRTTLFTALAALAFSTAAWAQSDPVFAHLDSNHDGRISLSEHGSAEKATFTRMDADHDGKLSAQEMASVRKVMTQLEIAAENVEAAALAQTKNARPGTKAATPTAEDAAVAQALFERLDANHDGSVSTAEMQAAHSRPPPAQARPAATGLGMAAVLDVNHDGSISATEHAAIARARFARMDTNGDGFVSSQEWDASHARQAAKTP